MSKSLADAIASWKVGPFARGTADCCAFADHVLRETTGCSYIPAYSTDEEAQNIIQTYGGLSEAVSRWMGRPPVEASELKPGDVVFLTILEHEAIGVLVSDGAAMTVFEDGGLRKVSAGFVDHGWRA